MIWLYFWAFIFYQLLHQSYFLTSVSLFLSLCYLSSGKWSWTSEHYLTGVKWISENSVVAVWSNRLQNKSVISTCRASQWICTRVSPKSKMGVNANLNGVIVREKLFHRKHVVLLWMLFSFLQQKNFYHCHCRSTPSRFLKVVGLTLSSPLTSPPMERVALCGFQGEMARPAISDTLSGLMSAVAVRFQLHMAHSRSLKSLHGTNPRKICTYEILLTVYMLVVIKILYQIFSINIARTEWYPRNTLRYIFSRSFSRRVKYPI